MIPLTPRERLVLADQGLIGLPKEPKRADWSDRERQRARFLCDHPDRERLLRLAKDYLSLPAHPRGTLRWYCRKHGITLGEMKLALEMGRQT